LLQFQLQATTVTVTCVHLTAQLSFLAAVIMYQLIAVDINLVTQWAGLDVETPAQFVGKR